MIDWIKQIPVEQTSKDKLYFLARSYNNGNSFDFWSKYLNGTETWSVKPGIAVRFYGGEQLVKTFAKNPGVPLVAIEVPADADSRWRKRKRRFRQNDKLRHPAGKT